MLYAIWKTNGLRTWTGGATSPWWVEADDEAEAVAIGQRLYPSRNNVDRHFARPVTDAEQEAWAARNFDLAARTPTNSYREKCAAVVAAYHARCGENVIRSLDRNVRALGGVTPAIERIAERIEARTAAKIEECYR